MKPIYSEIATLLLELQVEMLRLDLWQAEVPTAEALSSSEPFCVDTLTFPQWLQFIFLPRMSQLIEAGQPLPAKCGIAPLAEEYFKAIRPAASELIGLLADLDARLERG